MTKRKVLNFDDLAASVAAEPVEAPVVEAPAPVETVEQPPEPAPTSTVHVQPEDEEANDPDIAHRTPRRAVVRRERGPVPPSIRTTHYMRLPVHDALRDIAHAERRKVSDLLNEGIDRVLRSRKYPSLKELWERDVKP